MFKKSVDTDKFITYIEHVAEESNGQKIALAMDNMGSHHAKRVKIKM